MRLKAIAPLVRPAILAWILASPHARADEKAFGDGGRAEKAVINGPRAVVVSPSGTLYVAEAFRNVIRRVDLTTGLITTQPMTESIKAIGGMVLDKNGDLIITEFTMDRIKKISTKTGAVTTLAGTGHSGFSGDGGLFISQYGYGPNSHRIRRVDAATGIIETIAGLGGQGYAGDGGPALSAQLGSPSDLVIDAKGNLWVVDPVNDHVRRIDNTSGFIDTVAGSVKGFFGDGGPATAARLSNPSGIALDSDGNLYIAEFVNNRVRCVDQKSGKIRTVAGNGLPHRVDVMM